MMKFTQTDEAYPTYIAVDDKYMFKCRLGTMEIYNIQQNQDNMEVPCYKLVKTDILDLVNPYIFKEYVEQYIKDENKAAELKEVDALVINYSGDEDWSRHNITKLEHRKIKVPENYLKDLGICWFLDIEENGKVIKLDRVNYDIFDSKHILFKKFVDGKDDIYILDRPDKRKEYTLKEIVDVWNNELQDRLEYLRRNIISVQQCIMNNNMYVTKEMDNDNLKRLEKYEKV